MADEPFAREIFNSPPSGLQPTIDALAMAANYSDNHDQREQTHQHQEVQHSSETLSFFVDEEAEYEISETLDEQDPNQVSHVLRRFKKNDSSPSYTR